MKTFPRSFLVLLGANLLLPMLGPTAQAQDPAKPAAPAAEPAPAAKDEKKETKTAQTELEDRFSKTLTKATLSGRWCMVKDGEMQPDKEEKYTISGVTRLWGENWLIHSRIEYGDHDITVPVPVKVKWAGDTAVITVDDFGIPGGSKYSARVMIYKDNYSGTWSGGKMGGLLHGLITQGKAEDKPTEKPAEKPTEKPTEKAAEKPAEK